MENIEMESHVEFACKVMELTIEGNLDNSTVMNGLAIATAAALLDMVADESGAVNDVELYIHEAAFIATLRSALTFAKEHVEAGSLISEN